MARPDPKDNPGVRPLFSKPKTKLSLAGAAILTAEEPDGPRVKLVCTGGDVNWVSKLPVFRGGLPARIGSDKSPVPGVRCLYCGERLTGGETLQ